MLGPKEVPADPTLAPVTRCGPGVRTEMPGEGALQESHPWRGRLGSSKPWKRPRIPLPRSSKGGSLSPFVSPAPKRMTLNSKAQNREHCKRKHPGLLGRRKKQVSDDCGETLVAICVKPHPTQVPGQKALLRGEKEPACRISTERSVNKGGVPMRLRKRRPSSKSKVFC